MKAKEMIEHLKKCNPDAELFIAYSGYYEPVIQGVVVPEPHNNDGSDSMEICIGEVETEE